MIYLDNAATTRPDGRALCAALSFTEEQYFNPSAGYAGGAAVRSAVERARASLLAHIANEKFALVFTSGGTESDNLAIFSSAKRGNAVTTAGEHAAVEKSFAALRARGIETRVAPLLGDGRVDADALLSLVDEKTTLVSVVHVGSETGAVNEIAALARAVKKKNPRCIFHSDGVQAFGKIPFRLTDEIDLYSVSAHKIGGLKGSGALYRRRSLHTEAQIFGGGQESGLRSGTENVLGILAFAGAAEDKFRTLREDYDRLRAYNDELFAALDASIFTRLSARDGSPYILTVGGRGLRGEVLVRMLWDRGVVVGTGSACSSKHPRSRALEACGVEDGLLDGVLRFSFAPQTSREEIVSAAKALNDCAHEFLSKV